MLNFLKLNLNGIIFWIFCATIFSYFQFDFFYGDFIADICSHFRIQYFGIAVCILLFYLTIKYKKQSVYVALAIIILLNGFEILSLHSLRNDMSKNISIINDKKVKIGLINLLTSNTQYEKVCTELLAYNNDILIIQEIDEIWSKKLDKVKEHYLYKKEILREDNFGIAIYSKLPIVNFVELNMIGELETPVIIAQIKINNKLCQLFAVHTTPPVSKTYFDNSKKILANISEYIKKSKIPTIVVGDINSSRFSNNYKCFINKTNLVDAGSPLQSTWPTYWLSPFRIQLDHIFYSKDFKLEKFNVGNYVGSDHFPVYAELIF